MRIPYRLLLLLALPALLHCCAGEPLPRREGGERDALVRLSVTGAQPSGATRSDLVNPLQPDTIYDLNIWQYSNRGNLLASFYVDELSATSGQVSVGVRSDVWTTDLFVVVANAGRALDAPAHADQRVSYPYLAQSTPSGYMGVLAVGSHSGLTQDSESNAWEAEVTLQRAMARLDVQLKLGETLTSEGASFRSGGVDVTDFFLMDSPAEFSFVPASPATVRSYTLTASSPRADLDRLEAFSLQDGGTVSPYNTLYCLPNLQGVTASGWLTATSRYADATTVGLVVRFTDSFGGCSPGMAAYRFFPAGDNRYADLAGGRNYRTTATIENTGAPAGAQFAGRRVDTRFLVPSDLTCEIGETMDIYFSTPLEFPEGTSAEEMLAGVSLSSGSAVHNDGRFEILAPDSWSEAFTDSVSGATVRLDCVDRVRLRALAPGESTLHYHTSFCGRTLSSSLAIKAVRSTAIDVGGDNDGGGDNNEYD